MTTRPRATLEAARRVRHSLARRVAHTSLDQEFYVGQDVFDLEMELIFGRHWLFAAMSCEIPRTGDWVRVDIGRDSVILIRDAAGAIRGHHNTCRHRGSRICLEERGHAAKLVCPYHQWTYETDGRLWRTRLSDDEFDKAAHGLIPVAIGEVGGFVFVSLTSDPPDFARFRADVEPYLRPHQLEHARVAHSQTLIEKANWKLVIENNRECYHCIGSHPELTRIISEIDDPADPRISPGYKALIERKSAEWGAAGLPCEHTEERFRYRAVRLPFLEGMQSMTSDGRPASRRLLGNLTDPDLGSVRLLSLPNTWNHILADHAVTFRVLPLGPEETQVTTKWLVHEEAVEGVDYAIPHLTEIWAATNLQDKALAENNQLGIRGRAYRPGPYSSRIEGGTRDFMTWYQDEMEAGLARLLDDPTRCAAE
jgi:Rieske 2Fe-2S family protein